MDRCSLSKETADVSDYTPHTFCSYNEWTRAKWRCGDGGQLTQPPSCHLPTRAHQAGMAADAQDRRGAGQPGKHLLHELHSSVSDIHSPARQLLLL